MQEQPIPSLALPGETPATKAVCTKSTMQPFGLLVGRILMALIFILSGFGKITEFAATAAYMTSKGMPIAEVLPVPAILIELGGAHLCPNPSVILGSTTEVDSTAKPALLGVESHRIPPRGVQPGSMPLANEKRNDVHARVHGSGNRGLEC